MASTASGEREKRCSRRQQLGSQEPNTPSHLLWLAGCDCRVGKDLAEEAAGGADDARRRVGQRDERAHGDDAGELRDRLRLGRRLGARGEREDRCTAL